MIADHPNCWQQSSFYPLYTTKVKGCWKLQLCSVLLGFNSLSFATDPVEKTVPGLGYLSVKVHCLQDVSYSAQLSTPVWGNYVVIVLEGFHLPSASASLSSPCSVSRSIHVTIFPLTSSYTGHQMTLLLPQFVRVCEMELSRLLSQRCTDTSPPRFSLFTPCIRE